MQDRGSLILLFTRYPQPGRVKTRLAASIGVENAALLARHFLLDVLNMLESTSFPIHIHFTPGNRGSEISSLVGTRFPLVPQKGDDLGERMRSSFTKSFAAGYTRILLVGSDLPDLPAAHIHAGFAELGPNHAVLGPSRDGGYYLIGFHKNRFRPEIFQGMDWGGDDVFGSTLDRMNRSGLRVGILPPWADVDYRDDLEDLMARAPDLPSSRMARRLLKGNARAER